MAGYVRQGSGPVQKRTNGPRVGATASNGPVPMHPFLGTVGAITRRNQPVGGLGAKAVRTKVA